MGIRSDRVPSRNEKNNIGVCSPTDFRCRSVGDVGKVPLFIYADETRISSAIVVVRVRISRRIVEGECYCHFCVAIVDGDLDTLDFLSVNCSVLQLCQIVEQYLCR